MRIGNGIRLSSVVLVVLFCNFARADVIVTVEPSLRFAQDSGMKQIDIFVRTTDASAVSHNSFTADFTLTGGAFVQHNNGFDDGGASRTGEIGLPGFIGSLNLQQTSFFIFDPSAPSFASLSLDFTTSQRIETVDVPIARLLVDINGLLPGDYEIQIDQIHASGVLQGAGSALGSFTVVPEPTAFILVGVMGSCICLLQRRRIT